MGRRIGDRRLDVLLEYLKMAGYPASREVLVSSARDHGAPDAVVNCLKTLPFRQFYSAKEALQAYLDVQRAGA